MGSSVRECSHHLRWFSTHDDKSLHAIHRKYDRRNVGALALYGRALRNSDAQLLKAYVAAHALRRRYHLLLSEFYAQTESLSDS